MVAVLWLIMAGIYAVCALYMLTLGEYVNAFAMFAGAFVACFGVVLEVRKSLSRDVTR